MAQYCGNCGAEMPDVAAFCPQCGSSRPPVKEKKKVKWWMIVIPLVLVIVLAVVIAWKPLYMHLMPEVALAKAVGNTIADIQARNEGSPFLMMAKAYDETKQNTVRMRMDYWDPYFEDMKVDMTLQSDQVGRRSQADLSMTMYGQTFDVGVYVDPEVMALGMDQLTGEDYYGIVYETFSQDIRGNAFLFDAIGEETVGYLEEYVAQLQDMLGQEKAELGFSEEYGPVFTEFLAGLEPAVDSGNMTIGGAERSCYTITYSATVAELGAVLDRLLDVLEEDEQLYQYWESYYGAVPDFDVEAEWNSFLEEGRATAEQMQEAYEGDFQVIFWLCQDRIVNIGMDFTVTDAEGETTAGTVSLLLGMDASEGDIVLTVTDTEDDAEIVVTLTTEKDENAMEETLDITVEGTEDDGSITLGYSWDREGGSLEVSFRMETVTVEKIEFRLDAELLEEEKGFTISLPNLETALAEYDQEVYGFTDEYSVSISMTVTSGAEITRPEFTNLGELTEEMLYQLMMNLYQSYGA